MSGSEIPDLVGKVIGVKYGDSNQNYAYIEVVSFELQAGRRFLVGKTVNDAAGGIRLCIDWNAVTAYYEFDSAEHCHQIIDIWYPPTKKSRFWFS